MIFQTSSTEPFESNKPNKSSEPNTLNNPQKLPDTPVVQHKITPIMPFFGQTLKQHWTLGLLISILYFFILPISLLMMLSLSVQMVPDVSYHERMCRDVVDWAEGIRYVLVISMSILAVVVSCVMQNYLHNKVSVDFYHSLPITRGRLITSQLIAGYLFMIIPCLIMYAAALIEIAAYGYFTEALLPIIAATVNETLVYSLFFYGLAALTGMIAGTTSIHFLLSCLFVFLLPLEYLVSIAFLDIFRENMWVDWYVNDSVMSKLSPAIRLCITESYLSPAELLCMLVFAAVFFVLAYFVYLRYRSERAGNAVVFPLVGEIIKYAVIYMLTLSGGLLFYAMTDNGVWTVFGMVCGAVLSFMLTNTILHKSAKAMFAGMKVFLIYSGVIVVILISLLANLFHINTYVPSPKATAQVEFCLESCTAPFRFAKPEQIEAIYRLYTESPMVGSGAFAYSYISSEDGDCDCALPEPETETNIRTDSIMYVNVVFYPKIGFPIAKRVAVYESSLSDELLKIIMDSDEFNEQYHDMIENLNEHFGSWGTDSLFHYNKQNGYFVRYYTYNTLDYTGSIKAALMRDIADVTVNYNYFQRPVLTYGYCRVDTGTYPRAHIYIPVFADMKHTEQALIEGGYIFGTRDEYIENLAEGLDKITVFDSQNNREQVFTQKSDIRAILQACSSLNYDYYFHNHFTQVDSRYSVYYELSYFEKYFERYDDSVDEYDTTDSGVYDKQQVSENMYHYSRNDCFLLGQIPSCVKQ